MREFRFRAWNNTHMRYSRPMPDIEFWDWVRNCTETVIMQYIGAKDAAGKRVYEGDIIEYRYKDEVIDKSIIEYTGSYFRSKSLTNAEEFLPIGSFDPFGFVAGNIYETPGLLVNDRVADLVVPTIQTGTTRRHQVEKRPIKSRKAIC